MNIRTNFKRKTAVMLFLLILAVASLPLMMQNRAVTAQAAVWDGSIATGFAGGSGTQASPYLIATAEQLAYLAQQVNAGNAAISSAHYRLTANIELNTTSNWTSWDGQSVIPANSWTPIGTGSSAFKGTFDGDRRAITGIYMYADHEAASLGLFANTNGASIANLMITNSYFGSGQQASSMAGIVVDAENTTFSSCMFTGKFAGVNSDTGGISARATGGSIYDCFSQITASFSNHPAGYNGGIVGSASGVQIKECNISPSSVFNEYSFAGSIAGKAENSVIDTCYNTVNMSSNYGNLGGIVALAENTKIINCYNTGKIHSETVGGGIAATLNNSTVENCYNKGIISTNEDNIGGIAALTTGTSSIANCYNTGSLSAFGDRIGGIIGVLGAGGSVRNSYTMGTAAVGVNNGTVTDTLQYNADGKFISGSVTFGSAKYYNTRAALNAWVDAQSGTDYYYYFINDSVAGNYKYSSVVPAKYTVVFSAGIGGGSYSDIVLISGGSVDMPIPPAAPAGYTHSGWQDSIRVVSFPYTPIGNQTLTAQYTLNAPAVANISDISAIYGDPASSTTLTASASHEAAGVTYSYQWQKKISDTYQSIDGKTATTLVLGTVADSGQYRIMVTAQNGAYTSDAAYSNEVTVSIVPQTLAKPTPGAAEITYNTSEQTYTPSGFDSGVMGISGNVGTVAGDYSATVSLLDDANYIWEGGGNASFQIPWTIEKADPVVTEPAGISATYRDTLADVDLPQGWEWTDELSTKVGSVGTQAFEAIYTPQDDLNYNTITSMVNITVAALAVAKPAANQTTYTYSGSEWEYMPVGFDSGVMGISGNKATDAGGYTAIISLLDTQNYVWEGGSTAAFFIEWSIEQADPETPAGINAVYGDTLADVSLPQGWAWAGDTGIQVGSAGSQSFEAAYTDNTGNYKNVTRMINVTVAALAVAKPAANQITFIYNGSEQEYMPVGFDGNIMDINGNKAASAGGYTATISLTDPLNHMWESGGNASFDIAWTIEKADPDVPENLNATYKDTLADVSLPQGWVWTASAATEVGGAGNQTFEAAYTDSTGNYNDITRMLTIKVAAKAAAKPYASAVTYTYNESAQTYMPIGFDSEVMVISGNTATNAGGYTATISLLDTQNYIWEGGGNTAIGIDWVIEKADPVITEPAELQAVYGDTLADITLPQGWAWIGDLSTAVGGVGEQSFEAEYTPADNNYNTVIRNLTVAVAAKAIAKPTANTISYTYDGSEHTYAPVGFDEDIMGISGNKATDAGGYTVSISLLDMQNYIWYGGSAAAFDIGWIIEKADPEMPVGLNATYGDKLSDISLPQGWAWTVDLSTAVGGAGEQSFEAEYTPADNNYNSVIRNLTVTVAPKAIVKPEANGLTYTYSGSEQTYSPVGFDNDAMSISGNKATNAGSYSASISLLDTQNYVWKGGGTGAFDIAWIIEKAAPDVTAPTGLKATYGDTLADVSLTAGWAWKDSGVTSVGNAGTNSFDAVYTPEDTENYSVITNSLSIDISKAYRGSSDLALKAEKITATSVRFEAIPGAEYSSDGGITWQASPEFNGLSSGKKYTFVARFAESDNYFETTGSEMTIELEKSGMPSGLQIALIALGVICLLILILVTFLIIRKKKRKAGK